MDAGPAMKPAAPQLKPRGKGKLPAKKSIVLLVSGDAGLLRVVRRGLSSSFLVLLVHDVAAALQLAAGERPALTLFDVGSGKPAGLEALGKLASADPFSGGIPVIALAAKSSVAERAQGLALGAADYLVKPYTGGELAARVSTQLVLVESRVRRASKVRSRGPDDGEKPGDVDAISPENIESLLQREERLRVATHSGKVGLWEWDIEKNHVTWTESLYEIHEVNPKDFIATVEGYTARVHPDDRERVGRAIQRTVGTGESYGLEYRAIRPSGQVIWLFTNASVVYEGARPVRLVGACFDITDRKHAEISQQETTARLRVALDAAQLGDWGWNAQSKEVNLSHRAASILGLPAARTFAWQELRELIVKDDWGLLQGRGGTALLRRADFDVEFRVNLGMGRVAWIMVKGRGTYNPQGQVTGMHGVVQDVTDRRRADEARRQLSAIVESSGDAIISKKLDGTITSWNKAAERLFGYPAQEAIGQSIGLLIPPDRQHEETLIIERVASGVPVSHYETVRRTKDGSLIDISLTVSPLRDDAGVIVGASKIARDVSQQKRVQEALAESEARFRLLADNIAQFAWITDASGHRLWVNKRLLDYTGMTLEEMNAGKFTDYHHPGYLPAVLERFDRHRQSGERWQDSYPMKGKDGRFRWFLAQAVPIRNERGEVYRWFGTNTDIDDLNQAQDALRRQNERLRLLSDALVYLLGAKDPKQIVAELLPRVASHLGTETYFNFMVTPEGDSLRLNACAGISPGDANRLNLLQFGEAICGTAALHRKPIHAEDIQHFGEDKAKLVRDLGIQAYACHPFIVEDRLLGTLSFASRERPAFTSDEVDFMRAISDYVALAIDRARSDEALRDSETQLRLVTDNAPVFLVQLDRDHRFKFANRPYAMRYGREVSEILGLHVSELTGTAAYEVFRHHIDATLAGKKVEFEMEIPYETLGSRWVNVTYVPEVAASGTVTGIVAVITDVTARKHIEQEAERARDHALAASRAKDDFLAALSHELRTPLSPVLLLASDGAEDRRLPVEVRSTFETIRKNVELEARLIDDLLDLTRVSHNKLALNQRKVAVRAIVADAVATVRADLEEKGISLGLEDTTGDRLVLGDPVRLQQVFWNVLKNAVKFTPKAGQITVVIRLVADGQRLAVTVADTGIGMTTPEMARIFEAFTQGDHAAGSGSHRFGGVGLGLTISRMLIELHAGSIHAASPGRNRGSTFTIELPTIPASEITREDLAPSSPVAATAGGRAKGGLSILLVDDHEPTRQALARLLSVRGHRVTPAGSVAEARVAAEAGVFDLLLSDIGLPDGTGYDLMAELSPRYGFKGIALSGYGMEQDVARSREAGFATHLTKPVSMQALDKALASVVAYAKAAD